MPQFGKTTLFAIIPLFFLMSFGWAQTPTEMALRKMLEEPNGGKTATAKKEKKTKTTPTTAPAGETEREKLVRLRALAIEASENLKKAENEAHRAKSPAMKQAEKEIAGSEKLQQKIERERNRISADAQVTGCPANTVWVNQDAEPPHWTTRVFPSVVVRIINTDAIPIDEISGPNGIMVRNLCARGAVTVKVFLGFLDSDQMQVPLMAIARMENGGIGTAQTTLNLNRYNDYQRVDNQIWTIHLNRQQQTR